MMVLAMAKPPSMMDPAEKVAQRAEAVNNKQANTGGIELPPVLTIDEFDALTSEQLSFVEFFSPYCAHCKKLAPTWEQTFREFQPELTELKVQMRQVNCVESGDLCEREEVFAYPNLRIYSPVHDRQTGKKTGRLKFVSSFPRSLVRTPENFKKFVKNAVAEYDAGSIDLPSASKEISLDDILKLIAGEATQPEYVMFYPGTAKQWEASDLGKSAFDKGCYDCMDNKRLWDKLSNQVLTTIGTSHFSCGTTPELCEKLGFKKLLEGGRNPSPRVVMFLPKSAGIVRFDYKGEIILEDLKKFANDLYENYQYDNVSAKTLSEIMEFRKTLPFEPLNAYYPLANKVAIVFYYDPATVTDEDRAILPYLLEYVTYSPFNMYIYGAKSDKFEGAINTQAGNLINYINYDEKEPPKQFNKALHLATTLTTKPTLLIIKDNTLFTSVYQSYAPEDFRNQEKIIDFVARNQFPLYQELTPELFHSYFDKTHAKEGDKIVVNFVDSSNAQKTDESLYKISLVAHEYHNAKNEYYFNDILEQRQAKQQHVEDLKKQNADSVKIIKEMRTEVPHLFDTNQVLFTFIDLAENPRLANLHKWNINNREYKPGDAIVITKDNKYYWDQALDGELLTEEPKAMRNLLQYLLDPKLVKPEDHPASLKAHLVGSPYPSVLRFMDTVHQRGFLGYVFLIVFIYVAIKLVSRFRKRLEPTGGIIGNPSKHNKMT